MELISLLEKTRKQMEDKLPFVVYSKPNSHQVAGIFQRTADLHFVKDFTETGFVFAPFSGDEIVLIPENQSEISVADFKAEIPKLLQTFVSVDADISIKNDFEKRVQKAIDVIHQGAFSKVVLSRKEIVAVPGFDPIAVFQKLLYQYPSAYSYCFFHPKVGLWLGAFSERLLKMKARQFETMSVAGTQPSHEAIAIWGEKEQAEQQFVTDFIVDHLKDKASELKTSEPYTMKAGNVMHIKTDISGTLHTESGLRQLISILHPTPAVCGLPKEIAHEFILRNEGYDREYYSGFFGEFNKDFAGGSAATDLYVNLRCMQVKEDQVAIYIGGGITKDSIPEDEWQETVNKSMTMKRILAS